MAGAENDDIVSAASDSNLTLNATVNGDTYIITRFQYGDVTIVDSGGIETNLIKFDYDVTITDYSENAVRRSIDFVRYQTITLTLSTGADVTVRSPEGLFNYQLVMVRL